MLLAKALSSGSPGPLAPAPYVPPSLSVNRPLMGGMLRPRGGPLRYIACANDCKKSVDQCQNWVLVILLPKNLGLKLSSALNEAYLCRRHACSRKASHHNSFSFQCHACICTQVSAPQRCR